VVPGQNATTIQVAAGVESCFAWTINNRNKGLCRPEDLPYNEILKVATPYLGQIVSRAYDWTPLQKRHLAEVFKENPHNDRAKGDIWQFQNFLLPL
jgi:homospermidine synthase